MVQRGLPGVHHGFLALAGKIALVTGGGRGIGKAICIKLAGEGAFVVATYVANKEIADSVVAEIKQAGAMRPPSRRTWARWMRSIVSATSWIDC